MTTKEQDQQQIADGERIIIGSFQCQMQLTNGRSLALSGQFYNTDTLADMHKRLDLFQSLVDRQYVRVDVLNNEAARAQRVAAIEQHVEKLDELRRRQEEVRRAAQNGGERTKIKLSAQELEILKRGDEAVQQAKRDVVTLDSLIAAGKKKLALEASA